MNHFTVIPNENASDLMFAMMGAHMIAFEANLFSFMQNTLGDQYKHGLWELRQYPNGAIALVFPSQEMAVLINQGERLSLEAASLYANVMMLSYLTELTYMADDVSANERFHDLTHALRDAISGQMNFIVCPTGISVPTAEQLALPRLAHPERMAIYRLLD